MLRELTSTGRLGMLERLEQELPPPRRLERLPGLGPELAKRVHEQLHVETLEDLEIAANDGSLEKVPGFGPRRTEAIRQELAGLLGRRRGSRLPPPAPPSAPPPPLPALHPHQPSVALLLELDAEYRRRASAGTLPTIAPRRFNPAHERWLPVLHAEREGLAFTALFSNTARAHELGRTRDWVVIYWGHDHREGQCTVVTETRGPLAGRRVVRGRELECGRLSATPARAAPRAPARSR
ncbi:MAG: helix-hairpin-helix domain-containing protein [Myxococcota bacterium]